MTAELETLGEQGNAGYVVGAAAFGREAIASIGIYDRNLLSCIRV
jgi:hypothetical protein